MKRVLLVWVMSWVAVGCSGAPAGEVAEGDEQPIVSAAAAPDPVGQAPTGGAGASASPEQVIDLRGRVLANETRRGPTDPMPWRAGVDDSAKK